MSTTCYVILLLGSDASLDHGGLIGASSSSSRSQADLSHVKMGSAPRMLPSIHLLTHLHRIIQSTIVIIRDLSLCFNGADALVGRLLFGTCFSRIVVLGDF